ncbi:hypothetical protein Dimus_037424, partial [Dionaea muscipula]
LIAGVWVAALLCELAAHWTVVGCWLDGSFSLDCADSLLAPLGVVCICGYGFSFHDSAGFCTMRIIGVVDDSFAT